MATQMIDAESAVESELFWAWQDAVRDGIATPDEAVAGFKASVWPPEQDGETEEEVATPALEGEALVLWYSAKVGRKFEPQDLSNGGEVGSRLYDAATQWLLTADMADLEWSEWLVKLANKLRKYRNQTGMTNAEAKGVLNSMVATLRRKDAPKSQPPVSSPAAPQKPVNRVTTDADDQAWDAWCGHQAAEVTKGYFTLVRDDSSHRTFRVGGWKADTRSADPEAKIRWIVLLTGPVNTADYETVGFQRENGDVVLIRQYRNSAEVKAMIEVILCGAKADRDGMRKAYAVESGNCGICGRALTTPESVALGIGPDCLGRGWL
jgi:hypothetical protein